MKILMYTDAHFSMTSSIMNRVNGYKYSERLDLLVESMKWVYEVAKMEDVDIIVNGGDTTDSDILLPEESSALSKAMSYRHIHHVPEYHLVGNHERKDKEGYHHSVALLENSEDRYILTSTLYVPEIDTLLVPFSYDYSELYESNEKYNPKYIISHLTYLGENFNKYVVMDGVDRERLYNFNSNLDKIFNGHIHNARESDDGKYIQIGALVGTSFSDSYSEGFPGVVILDTESGEYKRYSNPYTSLYYKMKIDEVSELQKMLEEYSAYSDQAKLCLRVEVDIDKKDDVVKYLNSIKDQYNISAFRVKSLVTQSSLDKLAIQMREEESVEFQSYESVYDALMDFTTSQKDNLPTSFTKMKEFLDKYLKGESL